MSKLYEFLLRVLNYNQGMRGIFFYSAEQRNILHASGSQHTNYAKLDNGTIAAYTECRSDFVKQNNFADCVCLGRGRYYRHDSGTIPADGIYALALLDELRKKVMYAK